MGKLFTFTFTYGFRSQSSGLRHRVVKMQAAWSFEMFSTVVSQPTKSRKRYKNAYEVLSGRKWPWPIWST